MKFKAGKKFFLLSSLLAYSAVASIYAGPGAGVSVGMSRTIEDHSQRESEGYEINTEGMPISGELFWAFGSETGLDAGVRGGLKQHIETVSPPDSLASFADISIDTTPFSVFARANLPYFFAEASGGIHFADIRYVTDSDDLSGEQRGLTAGLAMGPRMTFIERLVVRAAFSANLFQIDDIGLGSPVTLLTLGLSLSGAWRF
ncbi:hypothetical protein K7J14_03295 [Treponema zuelzerae]|uniref:Outer membrane protein beta-barrel domain-containing protein n=1 Tax=Teretinema zuelzerae TaxID=156 RepID=A0AAE3EHE4_9SPIR|nr:hypothetical protein [Teretinema zuelzerae]MCD1653723.1 hypothetical protein [Teretinema zuelzerae]